MTSGDPGYPDDIRQYDHDPRSPFYNDPTETAEFEAKQREMWERNGCRPTAGFLRR